MNLYDFMFGVGCLTTLAAFYWLLAHFYYKGVEHLTTRRTEPPSRPLKRIYEGRR